jgi:SAM-dependent methyltransferase
MSGELYSDYMQREPHPRNAVFIKKWHGKLLSLALKDVDKAPTSVLEIGPGHGYFAEHRRQAGMAYEFCDTSPAVVSKMNELGFSGHLGLVQDAAPNLGTYDMIWMSHVLEHSPTWLSAREMISAAKELLNENGFLVVVGPDALSWKKEFWNVDWSHGYPTTIRNVSQLFNDVGLSQISARHHRSGSFNPGTQIIFALLSKIPHRIVDRVLTPSRSKIGDGFLYSWKAIFGWRQILVKGHKRVS